tara:strand:- start:592 stop:897 length:306 start_codon:yes stop_codon:yes gene_type:complete
MKSSSSNSLVKLINTLKSKFKSTPKTVPGRWGNVGDFASDNEKVKLKREGTWATWTNMDHCGDDVCGTPKTYSMVNDDIVVDDIIENSNISSKSKNKKDKS